MRKILVGLLVVGLLAVAAPAMASWNGAGAGDPLGLIVSGAVLPYFGDGASGAAGLSLLELYAPRAATNVHMFFFDVNCVRQGDSVNVDLTANDVELVRVDAFGNTPTTGLVVMADVDSSGFSLEPWFPNGSGTGIMARMWWVDVSKGFVRVIDPIAADTWDGAANAAHAEWPGQSIGFYSPLRTGAAFFAPREASPFATTIYFVCPNDNVIGSKSSAALSTARDFPPLIPAARASSLGATPIRLRVYDDEEGFLRDVQRTCVCLDAKPVATISSVYSSAVEAPNGTYTEVFGGKQSGSSAVCDETKSEPLATINTVEPFKKNSGNACNFAVNSWTTDGVVIGVPPETLGAYPTAQYVQITPAVAGAGPYPFTAYRAINIPSVKLDIFGRVSGAALETLEGSWFYPSETPDPWNGR
jgi:hypothetical protein